MIFEHKPGLWFVVATLLPLLSFVVLLLTGMIRTALRPHRESGGVGQAAYELLGGDTPRKWPAFVATAGIGLAFVCSLIGTIAFFPVHHELHDAKHGIHNGIKKAKQAIKDLQKELVPLGIQAPHIPYDIKDELESELERAQGTIQELQEDIAKLKGEPSKKNEAKNALKPLEERLKHLTDQKAGIEKLLKKTEETFKNLEDLEKREHALQHEFQGSITWVSLTTRKWTPAKDAPGPTRYTLGLREPGKGTPLPDPDKATSLTLGFSIDTLSVTMFLMVTFIATLIHIFSIGYMSDELNNVVADHQVHTAGGHLHRRGRFGRFFMFLSLFCFSMLNLVLADNLFQVFVSWELVGVCSYLLIGFYYERTSAGNAANKAFITNRIGDAGFIIGMLILWTYVGTFSFDGLFSRLRAPDEDSDGSPMSNAGQIVRVKVLPQDKSDIAYGRQRVAPVRAKDDVPTAEARALIFPRDVNLPVFPFGAKQSHFHNHDKDFKSYPDPLPRQFTSMPYWLLVVAGLGIFLGCVGKSAQFPLQVWLPDAMEGPTPVSTLIHAATMVAAGVYLVGRVFPLFTPEAQLVIAYTGAITLFVAATIAVVQTDIKKVLAYSTVSQLGYMMLALGVGGWVAGLFHLVTHAFFKALLFLCSGAVIYNCHHEQDMTKMGGLYPKMKITALTMLVGVLTIAGTPFFSGWYSKDAILAHAFGFVQVGGQQQHFLLFLLPLLTAGITTFYMFRMWYMTFAGTPRDEHIYQHAHESPKMMTVPLIILAIFSVIVAWGWPIWDSEASALEHHIHHSQPKAIIAEFGILDPKTEGILPPLLIPRNMEQRPIVKRYHHDVGNLALLIVVIAFVFASLIYYYRVLDPAEAKEQFPGVHRFLWHKWYFDEIYSALLVRPALQVARWFRLVDSKVIDGFVDNAGRATIRVAKGSGEVDRGVVDGMANLIARVFYSTGAWLRTIQTGYLRSYVLFLVLAAVGIWMLLTYFFA